MRIIFWILLGITALVVAFVPAVQTAVGDYLHATFPGLPASAMPQFTQTLFVFVANIAIAGVFLTPLPRSTEDGLLWAAQYQRRWDAGELVGAPEMHIEVSTLPRQLLLVGDKSRTRRVQRALIRQSVAKSMPVLSLRLEPGSDFDERAQSVIARHRRFAKLPWRSRHQWHMTRQLLWFAEPSSNYAAGDWEILFNSIRSWHELRPNCRVVVFAEDFVPVGTADFEIIDLGRPASAQDLEQPADIEKLPEDPVHPSKRRELVAPLAVSFGYPLVLLILGGIIVVAFGALLIPVIGFVIGTTVLVGSWLLAVCWSMWPPRLIAGTLRSTVLVALALAAGVGWTRVSDIFGTSDAVLRLWDALGSWVTFALLLTLVIRRAPLHPDLPPRTVFWSVALVAFTWLVFGTDQIFLAVGLLGAVVATTRFARWTEATVLMSLAITIAASTALYFIPLGATESYGSTPATALAGAVAVETLLLLRIGKILLGSSSATQRGVLGAIYWGAWMVVCIVAPLPAVLAVWGDFRLDQHIEVLMIAAVIGGFYGAVCLALISRHRITAALGVHLLSIPAVLGFVAYESVWSPGGLGPSLPVVELLFGLLLGITFLPTWLRDAPQARARARKYLAKWLGWLLAFLVVFVPTVGWIWALSVRPENDNSYVVGDNYNEMRGFLDSSGSPLPSFLATYANPELILPACFFALGLALVSLGGALRLRRQYPVTVARGRWLDVVENWLGRIQGWGKPPIVGLGWVYKRLQLRVRAFPRGALGPAAPGRRVVLVTLAAGVVIGVNSNIYPTGAFPPLVGLVDSALWRAAGTVAFLLIWMCAWVLRHGSRDLYAVPIALMPLISSRLDEQNSGTGQVLLLIAVISLLLGGPSHRFAPRRFRRQTEFWMCAVTLVAFVLLVWAPGEISFWGWALAQLAPVLMFLIVRDSSDAPLSYRVSGAHRGTRRAATLTFLVVALAIVLMLVSGIWGIPTLTDLNDLRALGGWSLVMVFALVATGLVYAWLNLGQMVRAVRPGWPFRYRRLEPDLRALYAEEDASVAGVSMAFDASGYGVTSGHSFSVGDDPETAKTTVEK